MLWVSIIRAFASAEHDGMSVDPSGQKSILSIAQSGKHF
jgi:hypothetical protein